MSLFNMILFYFMTFGTILITFAVFPSISRKNLLFGVTIPAKAQNDAQVKAIKKSFIKSLLLVGAILTIFYLAGYLLLDEKGFTYVMMLSVFALVFGVSGVYFYMWRKATRLKQEKGWEQQASQTVVADTTFSNEKRSISPLWMLLYPVIIAATVLLGYMMYDKMPERIPMQIDTLGNVTRYATKSMRLIYFAPAVQAVMALIFSYIYYIIRSARTEIDPENAEVSIKQNAIFRRRWSGYMILGGSLLLLVFFCMQLAVTTVITQMTAFYISMAMTALMVAGVVVLAITTGQSGSRVRLKKTKEGGVINRSDDKHWKLGMFYYNPDDPALFVEKRFGVGFTNNFARPMSWILFVGIIGLLIAIGIISAKLAG